MSLENFIEKANADWDLSNISFLRNLYSALTTQRLGELKAKGDIIDFRPISFSERDGTVYLDLNVMPKVEAKCIAFEIKNL